MIRLGLGIPVWHADPHDNYRDPISPGAVIERMWVDPSYTYLRRIWIEHTPRDGKPHILRNILEDIHIEAETFTITIDGPIYSANLSSVSLEATV
jgi:hypothetical protein